MEFSSKKYTMQLMKSGKREITEGIELPNQEGFRKLWEKENYKYPRIFEMDTINKRWRKKN